MEHSWERMKNQPKGLNLIGCLNENCQAIQGWTESECPKLIKWAKQTGDNFSPKPPESMGIATFQDLQ